MRTSSIRPLKLTAEGTETPHPEFSPILNGFVLGEEDAKIFATVVVYDETGKIQTILAILGQATIQESAENDKLPKYFTGKNTAREIIIK